MTKGTTTNPLIPEVGYFGYEELFHDLRGENLVVVDGHWKTKHSVAVGMLGGGDTTIAAVVVATAILIVDAAAVILVALFPGVVVMILQ